MLMLLGCVYELRVEEYCTFVNAGWFAHHAAVSIMTGVLRRSQRCLCRHHLRIGFD